MSEPHYPQRRFSLPPDATEIVLLRHGASAHAVEGEPFPLVGGQGDPPLAPEGEAQALAAAFHGRDLHHTEGTWRAHLTRLAGKA